MNVSGFGIGCRQVVVRDGQGGNQDEVPPSGRIGAVPWQRGLAVEAGGGGHDAGLHGAAEAWSQRPYVPSVVSSSPRTHAATEGSSLGRHHARSRNSGVRDVWSERTCQGRAFRGRPEDHPCQARSVGPEYWRLHEWGTGRGARREALGVAPERPPSCSERQRRRFWVCHPTPLAMLCAPRIGAALASTIPIAWPPRRSRSSRWQPRRWHS